MLSRTQAGPGRTVKQEQDEISPNHEQRINLISVLPPSVASISNTHSLTSNLPLSIYVYSKQFLEFGCKVEPYINSFHIPLSLVLVVESESTIFYGFIDAEETSVAQFLHDLMRRVYLFFLPLVTMLRDKTYTSKLNALK